MILQALSAYYERHGGLPRPGWTNRGVDYLIVLEPDGNCTNIETLFELEKNKAKARSMLLPAIGKQAAKHTNSGKDANLLWDNASFVLGRGKKGTTKLRSFIDTLEDWFASSNLAEISAVISFCRQLQNNCGADELLERFKLTEDFAKRDPVLAFKMRGDLEPVHQLPAVLQKFEQAAAERSGESSLRGPCLITGLPDTHLAVNEVVLKGVWGGQTSGNNLVSFNNDSFESYGKKKGENCSISKAASFQYTTALNHLLASYQRMQVGDTSTVFWAEEEHELENAVPDLFGEPPKDEPDRNVAAVEALYSAARSGKFAKGGPDTRFHVLGLAPNAARISIRFWETASAFELGRRIQQHFEDTSIVHRSHEPDYLSLFRLLTGVAVLGKADNIPPNLGGEVMRAILQGQPYPASLFNLAVQRCRAEQQPSYARAAIIKGCLNRLARRQTEHPEEYLTMLDPQNQNPAYRLGRLFATLEKAQEEANPGLNATIRDRYYGAASSTPVAVFSTLLRLKNHHLGKLPHGRKTQMEKLIGEITAGLEDFPPHLHLADQGRFALGYYHQRQDFFTRKDTAENQETAP